jgi:hypothetical protein
VAEYVAQGKDGRVSRLEDSHRARHGVSRREWARAALFLVVLLGQRGESDGKTITACRRDRDLSPIAGVEEEEEEIISMLNFRMSRTPIEGAPT